MSQVDYRNSSTPKLAQTDGRAGVCMMSTTWKESQHPSFVNFIHSFLAVSSFRLNIVPIAPDFIFNSGGLSVAFVFVTNWDRSDISPVFSRVLKLKTQFAHFYVVAALPTKEQNESFVCSYLKHAMGFGRPVFVPVRDLEMGFMKLVNIARALGVSKRHDGKSRMEAERERAVQAKEEFLIVLTSIPGIDNHDANSLQAIGSIEAIAKASKETILESTDLSADKVETITRFIRDPNFYLKPKIF